MKMALLLGIGLLVFSGATPVEAKPATVRTISSFKITSRYQGVSSHGQTIPVIYDEAQKTAIGMTLYSDEECRRAKTGAVATAWHQSRAINLVGTVTFPYPLFYKRFGYDYIEMDVRVCDVLAESAPHLPVLLNKKVNAQ